MKDVDGGAFKFATKVHEMWKAGTIDAETANIMLRKYASAGNQQKKKKE